MTFVCGFVFIRESQKWCFYVSLSLQSEHILILFHILLKFEAKKAEFCVGQPIHGAKLIFIV